MIHVDEQLMVGEFDTLAKQCGAQDMFMAAKWGNALIDAYTENHRFFHNLEWLRIVQTKLDALCIDMDIFDDTRAVELACWFSHFYLNPQLSEQENRIQCAKMLGECLKDLGIGHSVVTNAAVLLVSSPQRARQKFPQEYAVLHDAQHEWMATTVDGYMMWLKLLKKENGHMSDGEFAEFRAKALNNLIARQHVYYCESLWGPVERLALGNATTELKIMNQVAKDGYYAGSRN